MVGRGEVVSQDPGQGGSAKARTQAAVLAGKTPAETSGIVCDIDWSWIVALKGLNVGELRVSDTIGGHDNVRIVFLRGNPEIRVPLPIIWVIAVLQKKANDWTKAQLTTFKARRTLVVHRFYELGEFA